MKQLRIIKSLTVLLLLTGCSDDDLSLNPNYPEELINFWIESYEEDYGTFRPSNYKHFPASWFRQIYNFMEENNCEYLVLSPVDAHYMKEGKWEYDKDSETIRIYKMNSDLVRELKVTSLTSNLLEIEI